MSAVSHLKLVAEDVRTTGTTKKKTEMVRQSSPRLVETTYMVRKGRYLEKIRVNKAVYANSAVQAAVGHMRMNDYGANVCEVHDSRGVLHATITYSAAGKMEIVFQRKAKEGE